MRIFVFSPLYHSVSQSVSQSVSLSINQLIDHFVSQSRRSQILKVIFFSKAYFKDISQLVSFLNISESEEPSEQNQGDGKENPSPGKGGAQGACGTTADENPGN